MKRMMLTVGLEARVPVLDEAMVGFVIVLASLLVNLLADFQPP